MRKKKATAQRRRQVNVQRVRRGPLGFLHVARAVYCDRIEGWYSRMPQNQLPLSGCYSWPTKCAPRASLPGGQRCCVVLWPSKGRIQYQALRSARIGSMLFIPWDVDENSYPPSLFLFVPPSLSFPQFFSHPFFSLFLSPTFLSVLPLSLSLDGIWAPTPMHIPVSIDSPKAQVSSADLGLELELK